MRTHGKAEGVKDFYSRPGKILSSTELADLLKVDIETINAWVKQDIPFTKEKKERKFDINKVIRWLMDMEIATLYTTPIEEAPVLTNLNDARAKRESYAARQKQLEVEEMEGKLIQKQLIIDALNVTFNNFKSRMLSIPSNVSRLLLGMQSINDIHITIKKAVNEALIELTIPEKLLGAFNVKQENEVRFTSEDETEAKEETQESEE